MATALKKVSFFALLNLSYESLGVVYGDLGTSPLYVFATTFPNGIREEEDTIGVLSLILWALTLSPLVKYCLVVLTCDDNGEGGTFALYSLLCRHVSLGRLRQYTARDRDLLSYTVEGTDRQSKFADGFKRVLERSAPLQQLILFLVLLATCMIIGDGVLTPAQSVLSAIQGIRVRDPSLGQHVVVAVSCIILAILFVAQTLGTHKIAFTFAPVIFVWFVMIAVMGIYHLIHYDGWGVFKALSPHYGIAFLLRNKKMGWVMLGGVFLTVTGTEAMYADISHFSPRAVQVAFGLCVYPCLMLCYSGQAAYLRKHPEHVDQVFYRAIPDPVYWPVFVVSTLAAAIASQSLISATFTIVKQSMHLGCFPRVKVVHTSASQKGQIYIPEINMVLLILTLLVTALMGNSPLSIGNAFGIVVSAVMLITTVLVTIALILVKRWSPWAWVPFFVFFFSAESVFLSANLYKFPHGGWVPVAFSGAFLAVMCVWRYGSVKKAEHMFENKLSIDWVQRFVDINTEERVPGVALFYSDMATGIPPIFAQFVSNVPILHEFVVFVSVKHIEVASVDDAERFFFRRLGDLKLRMFRCVVRYGYAESKRAEAAAASSAARPILSDLLLQALAEFLRTEDPADWDGRASSNRSAQSPSSPPREQGSPDQEVLLEQLERQNAIRAAEVEALRAARDTLPVHVLGRSYLTAKRNPLKPVRSLARHFLIDYAYHFLKANTRDGVSFLDIPKESILEVGMPCQI